MQHHQYGHQQHNHQRHNLEQHGHQHASHSHHPGCSHMAKDNIPPQQYFEKVQKMKQNGQIEFYWMEHLKGTHLQKKLQALGVNCVGSLNCQILVNIVGMCHMMLNFGWLPHSARPFISGLFWPLLALLYLNYRILSDFENQQATNYINIYIVFVPILLYTLAGLRGSGTVSTPQNVLLARKVFQTRPYLSSPNLQCQECKIPKIFRTMHCPLCRRCVPKFTRHSLVFGICIGAANQLLVLLFFVSLVVAQMYIIGYFVLYSSFGALTMLMFYTLNLYIMVMSLLQVLTLYILNFYYGVTEFEIQARVMLQYLMNVPERSFKNTLNSGLYHNLKQAIFALFCIPGFESRQRKIDTDQDDKQLLKEQISNESQILDFPKLDSNTLYTVNWAKAHFYLIPHMPNHPLRKQVIQIMKQEEPKMIQNFKLLKKFRAQVEAEFPNSTDLEKQQKVMMKMQEFMMKNGGMAKPSPQQQKAIQLQWLSHLKGQFKGHKQLYSDFESIEHRLKNAEIQPEEAVKLIREMQQKVMQVKMKQLMEQQQLQKKSQNSDMFSQKQERQQQPASHIQSQLFQNSQPIKQLLRPPQFSPQQQKTMQIAMITNMKKKFENDQQIYAQLDSVLENLKNGTMNAIQISMAMRGIQQQIMKKRMHGFEPSMMQRRQVTREQQMSDSCSEKIG